jgi:hypothetical protein
MNQFEGFEYPISLVSVDDVANAGGAVAVNSKFGRRLMSFSATFTCDVLVTRRTMLAALRQTGYLKLIKFTTLDNIQLQTEAYITNILAPYTMMKKPILIEMVSPDWRFYSQTEDTESVAAGATEVIANGGNEITNPVFEITGPGSSIAVDNLSTGEGFTITDTLISTDVVVIDTVNKTVTKNGANAYSTFSGDFFSLLPGNNSIEFTVTGDDVTTNLDVIYRDAYNGL